MLTGCFGKIIQLFFSLLYDGLMEIQKYKKNQVLFNQGDVADFMFEIVSGRIGIYMDYEIEDGQKELGILEDGDFLGELEFIDASARIATAVALDNEVVVKRLNIDDFNQIMKERPAKVILMIQQLCGRVRELDRHYLEACQAIDEYRKAEEENIPKSESLLKRLVKFSTVARKRG